MNAFEWTKEEYARLSRTIDFEHLPPRKPVKVKYRIISITKLSSEVKPNDSRLRIKD